MSTFLLIWDLCKLKPETRWNWPSFSNKLIFWPGLWENSQRFWSQMSQPRDSPGAQSWFVPGTWSRAAGRPAQIWKKENMWTDPSRVKILVSCLLMGPFSLPLHWIGSPKPMWVRKMDLEGTGRTPGWVVTIDQKIPFKQNIEILSAVEMLLKRGSLGLLVFISPPCERVTKCCRTRQVTSWRVLFPPIPAAEIMSLAANSCLVCGLLLPDSSILDKNWRETS